MFVATDDPFQRAVLADCRGDGNHDGSGCAVDWTNSDRCLNRTHSATACHSLAQRLAHGRGCSCAANLKINGGWNHHWAYVSLSKPSDAACPLLPLPEHASDGTCTGGAIPHGGGCAPHCGYAVRGDATATCRTSISGGGYDVSLGLWKGMCGASIDSLRRLIP